MAAATAAALLLAVGPVASATGSGGAPVLRANENAQSSYQQGTIKATNKVREKHHLHALEQQKCLQKFAVRQATRQANALQMYHQNIDVVMDACGLNLVGENIAYGFTSPAALVNAWMHSPPHRHNILKAGYRLIGLGARQGTNGLWYVSQVFGRKG